MAAQTFCIAHPLQVFEGVVFHLPMPKTFCQRDLEFTADVVPFFPMSLLVVIQGRAVE